MHSNYTKADIDRFKGLLADFVERYMKERNITPGVAVSMADDATYGGLRDDVFRQLNGTGVLNWPGLDIEIVSLLRGEPY